MNSVRFLMKHFHLFLLIIFLPFGFSVLAQSNETTPVLVSSSHADTWVAKDAIGRKIEPNEKVGIRKNKYVGIFYFVWQGAHGYDHYLPDSVGANPSEGVRQKLRSDTLSPYNISKLLKANPKNPAYGPIPAFHYWDEPYFGYYLPDDELIIRKHAQMLSDAGIDVLIIDVTNGAIYLPQVTKIASVYLEMRKEGLSTPATSFIVNSNPVKTVNRLYDSIYKKGVFKELWFYWKGKPLLLCPPEALSPVTKNFFNSRQSWALSKDQPWFADGKDKWPWLDHRPQSYGWHESKNKPEEISVAIAEHPVSNIGRSFHNGKEPEVKRSGEGLYFNEQWKRALSVNPEFIFVTGWNEWVAMRFNNGASESFLGKQIKKGDTFFVDFYSDEYSRDAEPVKGSFEDNYYYQLVNKIRQFKGTHPIPVTSQIKKIAIDGKFSDWEKVTPVFLDDQGDIYHRHHPGWGRISEYVNNSGRNDIVESKVASAKDNVFFYVKTAKPLTSRDSSNWMRLFISIKDSKRPLWAGFQYLVNRAPASDSITEIEECTGGWNWRKIATISYRTQGNKLEMIIPKKIVGITGNVFTLDFKWSDNSPLDGNPMDWLDKGDTAPNGRFAYRYIHQ